MSRQDNPTGFSKAGVGGHAARSMMYLEMRMERRLINRIDDFEMLTKEAGHPWVLT